MSKLLVLPVPDLRGDPEKWAALQAILHADYGAPIEDESKNSPTRKKQKSENNHGQTKGDVPPRDLCCPITSRLMREPVTTSDGFTFEREAIEKWFETHNTSPLTGVRLDNKQLTSVVLVKNCVDRLLEEHPHLRDSKDWYLPESWVVALGKACRTGDEAAIVELVKKDRRLLVHTFETGMHQGKTALHLALVGGYDSEALDVIVRLLEQRQEGLALAAMLHTTAEGLLPLHEAALMQGRPAALVKLVLWMGKSVEQVTVPAMWPPLGRELNKGSVDAVLMFSVARGDVLKVACLLRLGANSNCRDKAGKHLLHFALASEECLKLLLEARADPNALNTDGMGAPLHDAVRKNSSALALKLVQHGARLDARLKDGTTPLHEVASREDTALADALWSEGKQLSPSELEAPCGADGDLPLHCAAKSGSTAMLHWLLARGAQATATNGKGQTVLHVAALHNRRQFAEEAFKLAEKNAFAGDCDGNTPLHLAAQAGAVDTVTWLLELGLAPLKNRAGQFPCQMAELGGHSEVVAAFDQAALKQSAKESALMAEQTALC